MRSLWVAAAGFVAGALLMLLGLWAVVGTSDVEHGPVRILEASWIKDSGLIQLTVESCNGAPQATVASGGDLLEVEVRAFSFRRVRNLCADQLTIGLPNQPTAGGGVAELLDAHTGEIVPVVTDP